MLDTYVLYLAEHLCKRINAPSRIKCRQENGWKNRQRNSLHTITQWNVKNRKLRNNFMLPILVCVVDTIKVTGNCSSFCQPNVCLLWLWRIANKFIIILQFTLYLVAMPFFYFYFISSSGNFQWILVSRSLCFRFNFIVVISILAHCIDIGNALRWDSAFCSNQESS